MLALGRADMQNARSVLLSKHNITFRRCICNLFLASVVVAILSANATLTLLNWPHIASLQENRIRTFFSFTKSFNLHYTAMPYWYVKTMFGEINCRTALHKPKTY